MRGKNEESKRSTWQRLEPAVENYDDTNDDYDPGSTKIVFLAT